MDDNVGEKPQKKPRKSVVNRKLQRWNPSQDQLALLAVDYVCTRQGILIPWEDVAKEIDEHLSGEGLKQHLGKVRKHRVRDEQKVPPMLEKGARRKAKQVTSSESTKEPKGGRATKIKEEPDSDGDGDTPAKGTRSTLLWYPPIKETKPRQNGSEAALKTPTSTRGRATRTKAKGEEGDNAKHGDATKSTTGKRGRKKQAAQKDDDADESDYDSPTKKQKTYPRRKKEAVNYNDQYDSDEDIYDARQEGDDDDNGYNVMGEYPGSIVKQETNSSQGDSANAYGPPPPFMVTANAGYQQGFLSSAQSNYDYNNGVSSEQYGLSPMMNYVEPGFQQLYNGSQVNYAVYPTFGFVGHGGVNGLPSRLENDGSVDAYSGSGSRNFDGGTSDTLRQQGMRSIVDGMLSTVPEEELSSAPVPQQKPKPKTPRKKASSVVKSASSTGKSKAKNPVGITTPQAGAGEGGVRAPVQKVENSISAPNYDPFSDNINTGTITIANDTGHGNFDFNRSNSGFYSNTTAGGMGLLLNTNLNQPAVPPFTTSPQEFSNRGFDYNTGIDTANPAFMYHGQMSPTTVDPNELYRDQSNTPMATSGLTPALNSLQFGDIGRSGSQLTLALSDRSSFASIYPSHSTADMTSMHQGITMDPDPTNWNPEAYEMQMPIDEDANGLPDPDNFSWFQ